jgi:dTDP-4-dehydrorhamnose reductase
LEIPDCEGLLHLDLSQPEEVWPVLPQCDAAVLCAAITSLEQCRQDPAATRFVNATQTVTLAHRLAEQGCFIVFPSTNLVFDGSKPHRAAADPTCPKTEYGRQKADAEAELLRLGSRVAVVRLTKVFHAAMPLVERWIESLRLGRPIRPFSDFVCAPIGLAATIGCVAAVTERRLPGIWQLSSASDISYAAIAARIGKSGGYDPALIRPEPAGTQAPLEHVPQFTTLDATRAAQDLDFAIAAPEAVVDETFSL